MCKREERPLFQGVAYSAEEESPDQAVFLNDSETPGDLGQERRAVAGGEVLLSVAAVPELSGGRPHRGRPQRVAQVKPPAVRIGECAVHPREQQGRGTGVPRKEAWRRPLLL